MAPARKSRSVNKRFTSPNEESLIKGVETGNKRQRKRKLTDKLGPQWTKEELHRFYEAYRRYGKDWKKVASSVRNRTMDMVDALYTMNRAYLSLPEGTASVVGLIAMMTDHYSIMDGTNSEQESNDGVGPSRKPQKHSRGKVRSATTRVLQENFPDSSQSHAAPSSPVYLSLLKKKQPGGPMIFWKGLEEKDDCLTATYISATQTRAVGKRTPRIPVKYANDGDNMEVYRHGLRMKMRRADDDVAHNVALALAEASHKGGSSQTSHVPSKRRDDVVPSLARRHEMMVRSESEMTSAKDVEDEMDEDGCEGSLGSTEADNGHLHRHISDPIDRRSAGALVVQRKGKKLYEKRECPVDDIKEACSGTEEGKRIGGTKRKIVPKYADSDYIWSPGSKKRRKKDLFGGDEGSKFDALQTLADLSVAHLSVMMPDSTTETEPTVPREKEKVDLADNAWISESVPRKEKSNPAVLTKRGDQSDILVQVTDSGTANLEEAKNQETGVKHRRRKSPKSKISEQGRNSTSRSKHSSQIDFQPRHGLGVKLVDYSSSSTDLKREGDESAATSRQTLATNRVIVPTKVKSRRKMDRAQVLGNFEELKIANAFVNSQFDKPMHSYHHGTLGIKFQERLTHCLSNSHLRRWCVFEWFYSSIDYPWFAKSDFVDYLCHVGMGHVRRLTRVEWGVIRSSLGRPRRFSQKFLDEEKEKLNNYRESVRNHYTELRTGAREGLPTDLARPLTVGQSVIAIHPQTREVHDGSVLTVEHDRCRVQFDRHELGVEFVKDIDCMPANPSEIMPASLYRRIPVDKFYEYLKQMKPAERSQDLKKEVYSKSVPSQQIHSADVAAYILPSYPISNASRQQGKLTGFSLCCKVVDASENFGLTEFLAFYSCHFQEGLKSPNSQSKGGRHEVVNGQQEILSQSSCLSLIQAKEADIRALAELSRVLDKKDALVSELKRMNDDVTEDSSLKDVDSFKKNYAAVLVQLDEVFEQACMFFTIPYFHKGNKGNIEQAWLEQKVASALIGLRQRNTYHGSSSILSKKSLACSNDRAAFIASFNQSICECQDSGSHLPKIVETSRMKAQKMVDAAIQATSSLKEGEDWLKRAEDAIDSSCNSPSANDPSASILTSQPKGSPAPHNRSPPPELVVDHAAESKPIGMSDECGPEAPWELITNCVSMLLMIQRCSERQFPPADVAQILDFAVASLHRSCSENIPVYMEIQKCVGIIRSQILALVPK
ncbi:ALWAYS EARLY 3-like protein [Drosera capensis]